MATYESDGIEIRQPPRNLWKDAILGMAGGVAGVMAMNAFWQALAAALPDDQEAEQAEEQRPESSDTGEEHEGPLDDIALAGPYHREDESAPETVARVAYTRLEGQEPSKETRRALAGQIHWATGLTLGGLYGLLRGDARNGLDLRGGLLFGAGAWFVDDEVLVPVLGLSEGPTAHGLEEHGKALGAHLAFGVATAAAAQALEKVL